MGRLDDIQKPSFTWHWRSLQDFKGTSWFTLGNYSNVILLVVFLAVALNQVRRKNNEAKKAGYEKRFLKAPEFPEVEEKADFEWTTTEPLQLRPFKPKYHLTMGKPDLRCSKTTTSPLFSCVSTRKRADFLHEPTLTFQHSKTWSRPTSS
jgi:hypothetical protein